MEGIIRNGLYSDFSAASSSTGQGNTHVTRPAERHYTNARFGFLATGLRVGTRYRLYYFSVRNEVAVRRKEVSVVSSTNSQGQTTTSSWDVEAVQFETVGGLDRFASLEVMHEEFTADAPAMYLHMSGPELHAEGRPWGWAPSVGELEAYKESFGLPLTPQQGMPEHMAEHLAEDEVHENEVYEGGSTTIDITYSVNPGANICMHVGLSSMSLGEYETGEQYSDGSAVTRVAQIAPDIEAAWSLMPHGGGYTQAQTFDQWPMPEDEEVPADEEASG